MKRENGVYFTRGNPFDNRAFGRWAQAARLPATRILEPFAGANHLIKTLGTMGICRAADSFDITPAAKHVTHRDTLAHFPQGYSVCITNPTWLAKNRATRLRLPFPTTAHDDLYKLALEKCLANCEWVAALIPESFIRANLFQERLTDFISLTRPMFIDTGHPVGLALFAPKPSRDVVVWRDKKRIGKLSKLQAAKPRGAPVPVRFNVADGNVGLIAIDNTREPSIRFCSPAELDDYEVRSTCRSITKLSVEGNVKIQAWNDCLAYFRDATKDVLLTSFKGIRKDGCYRRRLDWDTARGIICHAQIHERFGRRAG